MIYFNEEKKEEAQINILPMIDVIFAILSFLIISSLYLTKINTIPLQLPLSNSTSRIDKKSLMEIYQIATTEAYSLLYVKLNEKKKSIFHYL